MGFTSSTFLFFFFPIVMVTFFMCYFAEKKLKWVKYMRLKDVCLIVFSIGFYGWAGFKGIPFLCAYVFLVYVFGQIISKITKKNKNKSVIVLAIIVIISVLLYFKYITFITAIINDLSGKGIIIEVVWMPLGISFITFSAISYLIDIYRCDSPAGTLLDVTLYLVLFTKVISGPIVLWKDFSPQISYRNIGMDSISHGMNRIMIGMAKKLILADYFGTVVLQISEQIPYGIDVITAWGCAILYTLQIYYDFAGYSDIAIGLSHILGINVKENFSFPYTAVSITEFWRRWHISLGIWFREYLYIPLGGNRKGNQRTLINLGIVFVVTGIWHGAGYNYIFWGILHGSFVIIERCIKDKPFYIRTPNLIKWFITMFIVNLGWEAFRISGFHELIDFYEIMFGLVRFDNVCFEWHYFFGIKAIVLVVIGVIGATALRWNPFNDIKVKTNMNELWIIIVQEVVFILLMLLSILCMVSSTYSPFIYFQY